MDKRDEMKYVGFGFLVGLAWVGLILFLARITDSQSTTQQVYSMNISGFIMIYSVLTRAKQPKRLHWMLGISGWYVAPVLSLANDLYRHSGKPDLCWIGIALATVSVSLGLKAAIATW